LRLPSPGVSRLFSEREIEELDGTSG